jgi:hypothetical protein
MQQNLGNSKIEKFWRWFIKNDELIRKTLTNGSQNNKDTLSKFLDDKVLEIGTFTWEITHGKSKAFSFTFSPNRSKELLQKTKEYISIAPELKHWEFKFAKPASLWDLNFELYDENVNLCKIDGSKWEFTVLNKNENTYEIEIFAVSIQSLDIDTQDVALDLVVTSLIGEQEKIEIIEKINFTKFKNPDLVYHPIFEIRDIFKKEISLIQA